MASRKRRFKPELQAGWGTKGAVSGDRRNSFGHVIASRI
jgi:hypothetical protein